MTMTTMTMAALRLEAATRRRERDEETWRRPQQASMCKWSLASEIEYPVVLRRRIITI